MLSADGFLMPAKKDQAPPDMNISSKPRKVTREQTTNKDESTTMRLVVSAAIALTCLGSMPQVFAADEASDFYRGKTIQMLVGGSAGA